MQALDVICVLNGPQERCEPGVCKVARYHGPLVLELKPDVPGVPRSSAERFTPGPACPAYEPAWSTRASSGDVNLLAGDGSSQRVHKLVLHCRLPVLHGQPVAAHVSQVSGSCLFVPATSGKSSSTASSMQQLEMAWLTRFCRTCAQQCLVCAITM